MDREFSSILIQVDGISPVSGLFGMRTKYKALIEGSIKDCTLTSSRNGCVLSYICLLMTVTPQAVALKVE